MVQKTSNIFSKLGTLLRDSNRVAVSANNQFATNDASATPLVSPLASVSTTVPVHIAVPTAAVQVQIVSTTAVRVSEVSGMTQYITVPASTLITLDCARLTDFYLMSDATAGNVSFAFSIV